MSPSWCSVVPGRSHGLWSVLTVHKARIGRVRSTVTSNPHSATSCECPITHARGIDRNWALLTRRPRRPEGHLPKLYGRSEAEATLFLSAVFSLCRQYRPAITGSVPASGRPISDRPVGWPSATQPAAGLPRESTDRHSSAVPDQQFSQAQQIPR